jgi:hypothetical protein
MHQVGEHEWSFLHFVEYNFWEIKMVGKKSTQNSKILQLKGLNVNTAATPKP